MAAPYTSVTVTGYNANPPPDDGTQTEANRVKWATIKTKLPDPLKTAIEAINTNIGTAFGKVVGGAGVTSTTAPYTVLSTDQGKLVRISSAGTVTTPDATDVDDPFVFVIRNSSSGNVVLDGSGAQTVDGAASITLGPNEGATVFTDGANWFTSGRISVSTLSTGFAMINGTLTASVGSNALTIAIKGADGNDPSTGNPVYVVIRNATFATGDFTLMAITAATSIVVSTGSTLGATNGIGFRIWVVGFNDGGTFRLGVINCRSGTSIYPLGQGTTIVSSTAEGGAGAADSAQVFYTGTAVTTKPYQILGYLTFSNGLATAGTWNVGPSAIQLYGIGVALPGQVVQMQQNFTGAVATGTTVLPNDDTIPQITEGNEFMTQAITPSATVNLLHIEHIGQYSGGAPIDLVVALFQDATASALAVMRDDNDTSTGMLTMEVQWMMLAATIAATTFRIRAGSSTVGTVTFNGSSSARKYGGAISSFLRVREIMA